VCEEGGTGGGNFGDPPKAMFMETGARPTAIAPAPMTIVEARQGYINITVPIGKKGGDMMEMKTMILIPFGKKEGDVFRYYGEKARSSAVAGVMLQKPCFVGRLCSLWWRVVNEECSPKSACSRQSRSL